MDTLAVALVTHPAVAFAYALLFIAMIGLVLWAAGFQYGVRQLITFAEDSHHVEHRHTWAMQGLYLLMTALGFWEAVRIFFYNAPPSYWWLVFVLLTPVWIPPVYRFFSTGSFKKKGGGH